MVSKSFEASVGYEKVFRIIWHFTEDGLKSSFIRKKLEKQVWETCVQNNWCFRARLSQCIHYMFGGVWFELWKSIRRWCRQVGKTLELGEIVVTKAFIDERIKSTTKLFHHTIPRQNPTLFSNQNVKVSKKDQWKEITKVNRDLLKVLRYLCFTWSCFFPMEQKVVRRKGSYLYRNVT